MDSYKIIVYEGGKLPDNYKPMIYSKWLRSLKYGNDYFRLIDQGSYFRAYNAFVQARIKEATIRLAVLTDNEDVVLGWSAQRGNVLDYVHVQRDFRQQGIGTQLLGPDITTITHITKQGFSFWNNRLKEAKFNPFI